MVGPSYNILKGTCRSYVELDYNMDECYKVLTDQLDWNNLESDRYTFDLSKPLPLKRVEDLQLCVKSYQKKLNISRPMMHKAGITGLKPYSAHDGTLISLRDTLKDMANNLEMGYTSVMPRRRWSNLDNKRSHIMIKYINRLLLDRRLMRSLEKFIGGRYYREDPRLLQRTI
ncbi:hypothetical protein Tco_0604553 [Tanacetum coccineum]